MQHHKFISQTHQIDEKVFHRNKSSTKRGNKFKRFTRSKHAVTINTIIQEIQARLNDIDQYLPIGFGMKNKISMGLGKKPCLKIRKQRFHLNKSNGRV
jgi:hypothetical protein